MLSLSHKQLYKPVPPNLGIPAAGIPGTSSADIAGTVAININKTVSPVQQPQPIIATPLEKNGKLLFDDVKKEYAEAIAAVKFVSS
jgi:hypothetical protein